MSPAAIAATGIAAGLSAGLAVLCWPRRLDPDPARRLEQLTAAPTSAGDAMRKRPHLRCLRRLSHNPWTAARRSRRRDTEAARLAPVAADLLASCLASGTTPDRAAEAVASAIRPPGHVAGVADEAAFELACRFQDVAHRLRLGGNPISSWREVAAEPRLKRVADAMGRAGLTGTAPAAPVRACADDLRTDHYAAGTAAARAAGVRATAPLAGCFLPAFVLIGVVPIVIGLADRLLP